MTPSATPLQSCYGTPPLAQRLSTDPSPPPLRILSVNCGGLGTKLAKFVALTIFADPDLNCLQEAGPIPPDSLSGLPYRAWWGPPVLGGGLVTLAHTRLIVPQNPPTLIIRQLHYVIITLQLTPTLALTIANTHLPPSLPHAVRTSYCTAVAASLLASPRGLRVICGDLNDSLPPTRGVPCR